MYRNSQHKSAHAAKDYYQTHLGPALGDYYTEGKAPEAEMVGRIHGKLAERLGLEGDMTKEQFFDLIDNKNPVTGDRLTQRTNADGNRRVGFDLYFDTGGKSISAYYARTKDPRVIELFDEAVQDVMREEVEPRMHVRVRQDGQNTSRQVANSLYTTFTHLTTRPTKVKDEVTGKWEETGTADPHIHQHVYLMNAAYDPDYKNRDGTKGAVMAAEVTDGIWNNAAYIQQNFHARLAKKFRDAGFAVKRTDHGIDLVGWNENMDQVFSRRKHQVEQWAAKNGIQRIEDKSKGGKATRSSKSKLKLTMEQQFNEWRARIDEGAWDDFLATVTTDDSSHWPKVDEKEAIDYALAHTLERNNSATKEEVLYSALDRGMGLVDVDRLKAELEKRDDVIQAKIGGQEYVTTVARLQLEQSVKDWAIQGQGTKLPLGRANYEIKPFDSGGGKMIDLNRDQQDAVKKLLGSTSTVMTLRGDPGVGKTTTLSQLIAGVEDNGGSVMPLGSTSNARDQMIQAGEAAGNVLANAENLAKFLSDKELQASLNPKSLVILDEVTQAGLEDIKKLSEVIEDRGARLLAVGDYRQLHAVPANGKIFEQLHGKLGSAAELKNIVRQVDRDYRKAVQLTASGDRKDVQAGFDLLVKLGAVREFDKHADRIDQAAQLYMDITGEKTNRRGKRFDWSDAKKQDPANYRSGQTVVMGKGKHAKKFAVVGRQAQRVMVVPHDSPADRPEALDLSQPKNFSVYAAEYKDALLAVGTHKESEQVSRKIRQLRKQAGELGAEHTLTRLESLSFTQADKKLKEKYEPGMVLEFSQKASTMPEGGKGEARKIWYGERFTVTGEDTSGNLLMADDKGQQVIAPLQLASRFDVLRERDAPVAVGDRIRMTKNGRTEPASGRKEGIRFSNNNVFTVTGFDQRGNPLIGNDRTLTKDFGHFRMGYAKVGFSTQGADASHVIILDSKRAGRARSTESNLVAISRGKRAATLFTDDIQHYREHAITRSSQRPSATMLYAIASGKDEEAQQADLKRIAQQAKRLEHVDEYVQQAEAEAIQAIGRKQQTVSQSRRIERDAPGRERSN
ncbi:MAG: hypothetical protein Aurels2KO_54920 [Aureliella sp.]